MDHTTPLHPHLAGLQAFIDALRANVDPPTDAELRAYVRTHMGTHLHLTDDLWALDDLTTFVEDLRRIGTTYARLEGTKVKDLARALEVDARTVLRQYPLPQIQIRTVPEQDSLELYERRPRTTAAQPLLLQLDLEDGELSVFPFPDVTPDQRPEQVDTGVLVRWDLPLLTPQAANTLMRQVKPLAQRMRFGTDLDQNKAGATHAGLDADAEVARTRIQHLCQQSANGPGSLEEIDADVFFGLPLQRTATEYDLCAATTTERLQALAEQIDAQAVEEGYILLGTAEHLGRVVAEQEVDTELVLAVVEGPYIGQGDVAEYGLVAHLLEEVPEIVAWVQDQQPLLDETSERWVGATFDPIDSPLPVQVFDLDEDTAIALARELDQHTPHTPE